MANVTKSISRSDWITLMLHVSACQLAGLETTTISAPFIHELINTLPTTSDHPTGIALPVNLLHALLQAIQERVL